MFAPHYNTSVGPSKILICTSQCSQFVYYVVFHIMFCNIFFCVACWSTCLFRDLVPSCDAIYLPLFILSWRLESGRSSRHAAYLALLQAARKDAFVVLMHQSTPKIQSTISLIYIFSTLVLYIMFFFILLNIRLLLKIFNQRCTFLITDRIFLRHELLSAREEM